VTVQAPAEKCDSLKYPSLGHLGLEEEEGVYTNMDWWTKIRLEVLRGETSKRDILCREGIDWKT
jgi:hypothetical protein